MYEEQLQKLGLSSNEAKIYSILLKEGSMQAGEINRRINLNRTTIYQVLDKLIEQGLISYTNNGKIKVFQASSPKRLISLQEEKKKLAQNILSNLENISKPIKEKVAVYQGRKGIKTIMGEILECKEYVSFGSSGEFLDYMKHDFYLFQKEKEERKIKSKVIIGKSKKNTEIVNGSHADFRFIKDEYFGPTTIWVYENKVAIIIWSIEPIATLIQSEKLSKTYLSYFSLLWDNASK